MKVSTDGKTLYILKYGDAPGGCGDCNGKVGAVDVAEGGARSADHGMQPGAANPGRRRRSLVHVLQGRRSGRRQLDGWELRQANAVRAGQDLGARPGARALVLRDEIDAAVLRRRLGRIADGAGGAGAAAAADG